MKRKDYNRLCAIFRERERFHYMMDKIECAIESENISCETSDLIYEIARNVEEAYLIAAEEKYEEEKKGVIK